VAFIYVTEWTWDRKPFFRETGEAYSVQRKTSTMLKKWFLLKVYVHITFLHFRNSWSVCCRKQALKWNVEIDMYHALRQAWISAWYLFRFTESLKKNESNKSSFYSVWFTDIRIGFVTRNLMKSYELNF
jgi:hypothetical protein